MRFGRPAACSLAGPLDTGASIPAFLPRPRRPEDGALTTTGTSSGTPGTSKSTAIAEGPESSEAAVAAAAPAGSDATGGPGAGIAGKGVAGLGAVVAFAGASATMAGAEGTMAGAEGAIMGVVGVTGPGMSLTGLLSVVGGPGRSSNSLCPAFAMAKRIRSEVKSSPSVSDVAMLEVEDDCQT